jgi:hypothetical protein
MAVSAETLLFGFDIVVFCCMAYVPKFHRNVPIRKQHVLKRLNVAKDPQQALHYVSEDSRLQEF